MWLRAVVAASIFVIEVGILGGVRGAVGLELVPKASQPLDTQIICVMDVSEEIPPAIIKAFAQGIPEIVWYLSRVISGFSACYFFWVVRAGLREGRLGDIWFGALCAVIFGLLAAFGDVIGGRVVSWFN